MAVGMESDSQILQKYDVSRETVDGGQILVIRIYENDIDFKPCYITAKGIKSGSFKRIISRII